MIWVLIVVLGLLHETIKILLNMGQSIKMLLCNIVGFSQPLLMQLNLANSFMEVSVVFIRFGYVVFPLPCCYDLWIFG
jgi:hypothetical protein